MMLINIKSNEISVHSFVFYNSSLNKEVLASRPHENIHVEVNKNCEQQNKFKYVSQITLFLLNEPWQPIIKVLLIIYIYLSLFNLLM